VNTDTLFDLEIGCTKQQYRHLKKLMLQAAIVYARENNPPEYLALELIEYDMHARVEWDECGWDDNGMCHVVSEEAGRPYETGEVLAQWQKDVGWEDDIHFQWAGVTGATIEDCGAVLVRGGQMHWLSIPEMLSKLRVGAGQ
jgi:hypothetical protein